jgi:hypothetical protein
MSSDAITSGILRPLRGLVETLNSKALGVAPNEMLQAARPAVELLPFMQAGIGLTVTRADIAAPISGAIVISHTVPAGEAWWLYAISYRLSVAVGDTVTNCRPGVWNANLDAIWIAEQYSNSAGAAAGATVRFAGVRAPSPILLPPGTQIGMCTDSAVIAGATAIIVWASYFPIQA